MAKQVLPYYALIFYDVISHFNVKDGDCGILFTVVHFCR